MEKHTHEIYFQDKKMIIVKFDDTWYLGVSYDFSPKEYHVIKSSENLETLLFESIKIILKYADEMSLNIDKCLTIMCGKNSDGHIFDLKFEKFKLKQNGCESNYTAIICKIDGELSIGYS